jgi:hypothetical protein
VRAETHTRARVGDWQEAAHAQSASRFAPVVEGDLKALAFERGHRALVHTVAKEVATHAEAERGPRRRVCRHHLLF